MTRRTRWTRTVAGAALPLALAAGTLTAPAASAGTLPVVATEQGAVRGAAARGVERFLGVPYAAPPTGALRWKAPRPAPSWSGVRSAARFGNACPVLPSTNGPRSETEDCLVANVWRPAGTTSEDRLPVHVFIHGGGLVNGSGAQNDESKLLVDDADGRPHRLTGATTAAVTRTRSVGARPRSSPRRPPDT